MTKIIIFAPNISRGGGKSLLTALLRDVSLYSNVLVFLDSRMELPSAVLKGLEVRYVKPTILNRAIAQYWLYKNVSESDKVLCFGSLPPLFRLRGRAILFIQNRYLIESNSLQGFNFRTKIRLLFERIRFRLCIKNADEFIVQSDSMKRALLMQAWARKLGPILIRPFISNEMRNQGTDKSSNNARQEAIELYKFVYIASGDPHKNHSVLIDAWCLLSTQGLFPSLCLTLDEKDDERLCREIELKKSIYGLNITNVGAVSREQVNEIYSNSCALIYPSILESFGLPLIEARDAGLFILAAELDYVRDFIDPDQTFDPHSAQSIARSVKRFLEVKEVRPSMLSGSDFLSLLFGCN